MFSNTLFSWGLVMIMDSSSHRLKQGLTMGKLARVVIFPFYHQVKIFILLLQLNELFCFEIL